MAWTPEHIQQRLHAFRESGQQQWETDYSRLLVFVCGNLDEMEEDLASSGAESDLRKATETAARMLRRRSRHCCRPSMHAPRS